MQNPTKKTLILSRFYTNREQLSEAKEKIQEIARRWKNGTTPKTVCPILNFMRENYFIRCKVRPNQPLSDAEQMLYLWVAEIEEKVALEMQEIRRSEKEDYLASLSADIFGESVDVSIAEEESDIADYGTIDHTEEEYTSVK